MNKKASMKLVITVVILAATAVLMLGLITGKFSFATKKTAEEFNISKYIPDGKHTVDDDLPDDIMNYASQLAHQLFDKNYATTNSPTPQGAGELLLVEKRELGEEYLIGFQKIDPSLPLHMYVAIEDGKKKKIYYLDDFDNQDFSFIGDYDICVIPDSNKEKEAGFLLHYATAMPLHRSLKSDFSVFSSSSNLDELVDDYTKDHVFFTTGLKPQVKRIVNGKGEETLLATKNSPGILAYRYGKTVCLLPASGGLRVRYVSNIEEYIRGKGYLNHYGVTVLNDLNHLHKKW